MVFSFNTARLLTHGCWCDRANPVPTPFTLSLNSSKEWCDFLACCKNVASSDSECSWKKWIICDQSVWCSKNAKSGVLLFATAPLLAWLVHQHQKKLTCIAHHCATRTKQNRRDSVVIVWLPVPQFLIRLGLRVGLPIWHFPLASQLLLGLSCWIFELLLPLSCERCGERWESVLIS